MKHIPIFACLMVLLSACGEEGGSAPTGSVEKRGDITVLRLEGTPYQMGLQHGELLSEGVQAAADVLIHDLAYSVIFSYAETSGLERMFLEHSYPDVLEECEGIIQGARKAGVEGFAYEDCVNAANLLIIIEQLADLNPGGCSQFIALDSATEDGRTVHARNMDWGRLQFVIDNPLIIVRKPTGKIPWVEVGIPGILLTLTAMNAEGLAVANNENMSAADRDSEGNSHPQMSRQIMQECTSLDEAEAFLRAQNHASSETLVLSDWKTGEAAVFEMSANNMGVRRLDENGIVYATNHFAHPDMAALHDERLPDHDTHTRFMRLEQLLTPGGPDSIHGQIDAEKAIAVLRDRYNPYTQETHPIDLFDGGGSIANNSTLQSVVMLPEKRIFYVALGEPPVPYRTFIGFSLDELLEEDDVVPDPPRYE
jgi:hypothetical protein